MNRRIKAFLDKYYDDIKRVALANDIDPAIVVTQAIHESGYGNSLLSKKYNNFFGIKARPGEPYVILKTTEQDKTTGEIKEVPAPFKVYSSPADSVKDLIERIYRQKRFKKAWENRHDPKKFFYYLQEGNYATDLKYAEKLCALYNQVVETMVAVGYIKPEEAKFIV